ncbi:hypothetical protein EDC94DRAFT_661528 [Helicostylum pulchrum]|nr:hypothetical protein EDC94DRAFT_661528 [Helicostylum pulchrum]
MEQNTITGFDNKEQDSFLAFNDNKSSLFSVVLTNLSLQHHISLFENEGIDLNRFLFMSETDFVKIGLKDPGDLGLLCNCSRALKSHIQQHPLYTHNEEDEENEQVDFFSVKSVFSSEDDDDDDSPLMTPSSIINAINAFDSYYTKRVPSPSIVVIPSVQTNTSSAQEFQHSFKVPGTVTSRPRNNNNNKQSIGGSRPVSMPIQLPSFSTPPPDYSTSSLSSIYGRRLDKCRSMIFPREEEGKEELPGYSCTVYKMGYVNVKKELDSPDIKSRYRGWRKLYIELWGTMLRVYRTAPTKTSSIIDYRNYYRWPLRTPYSYYHKYYYTPMFTISLAGAEASRALDYFRRPNALRLTTQQGPQLLLRLSSNVEMISWVEHLQAAINISLDLELRPMPKFITIPTRTLATGVLDPRSIEIERIREQRRRDQREVLI